jgi:dienelactone hydrolase
MRWLSLLAPGLLLTAFLPAPPALTFPPPQVVAPDAATRAAIEERTEKLAAAVERLRRLGVHDPGLADVEIYLKAAKSAVALDEFYGKNAGKATLGVLDRGLLRASQLGRGENPWLQATGQTVVRAYRSVIDGSVQPYAVTLPADYAADARKRYRVDVVLHGRDAGLTEVSFLHRHRGDKPAPKDLDHVRLDVYGRGNNAYRWAGEQDVWEASRDFFVLENMRGRGKFLDAGRVVLRGFSMGGAGVWHIGLHKPDQFCVLGPGAGFTTTVGYVGKDVEASLTDYQKACLHIYDAADYAENAFDVPVVAYSGEADRQIAAARNIEERLKPLGLKITHLVAPKLKHQFPDAWQKKALAEYALAAEKDRPDYPRTVRFVTYTLKYPSCFWVRLMGLDRHYRHSRVEARQDDEGFVVKTQNVRVLRLALWPGALNVPLRVDIDGQKLANVLPHQSAQAELAVYLEKRGGRWGSVLPERLAVDQLRSPQKATDLQGPIDDAFMAPFLCVRGTGEAWNPAVDEYARASLARFRREWSKYFRGELPVKDDVKVTAEDVATRHLILFGDPGSNRLIAQVAPRLPLTWTEKTLTWAGKAHDASTHVPVLIYPSPLAVGRYVVLNSGHTFHEADFVGTNALLYPRLGDHAVLKLTGGKKDPLAAEVLAAGLFDDSWRPNGKGP